MLLLTSYLHNSLASWHEDVAQPDGPAAERYKTCSRIAHPKDQTSIPRAIIHVIKGQSQGAAQTPGERNEALGLLALCWLLTAGVFIAVKWAGSYTPPWTLVFFRLLFATLFLLPFVASHYREMAARLRDHYKVRVK